MYSKKNYIQTADYINWAVTGALVEHKAFWGEAVYRWSEFNGLHATHKYIHTKKELSHKNFIVLNVYSLQYFLRAAILFLEHSARKRVVRVLLVGNDRLWKVDVQPETSRLQELKGSSPEEMFDFSFLAQRDGSKTMLHFPYIAEWVPGLLRNMIGVTFIHRSKPGKNIRKKNKMWDRVDGLRVRFARHEKRLRVSVGSRVKTRRLLGPTQRRPDFIIFFGSSNLNAHGPYEASRLGIPTIGLVNSDATGFGLTYPIRSSDSTFLLVKFYFLIFFEALKRGQNNTLYREVSLFSCDKHKIVYNRLFNQLYIDLHQKCLKFRSNIVYRHWLSVVRLSLGTKLFHYRAHWKDLVYRDIARTVRSTQTFRLGLPPKLKLKRIKFKTLTKVPTLRVNWFSTRFLQRNNLLNSFFRVLKSRNSTSDWSGKFNEKALLMVRRFSKFVKNYKKVVRLRVLRITSLGRKLLRRFFNKINLRTKWFWYFLYKRHRFAYDKLNLLHIHLRRLLKFHKISFTRQDSKRLLPQILRTKYMLVNKRRRKRRFLLFNYRIRRLMPLRLQYALRLLKRVLYAYGYRNKRNRKGRFNMYRQSARATLFRPLMLCMRKYRIKARAFRKFLIRKNKNKNKNKKNRLKPKLISRIVLQKKRSAKLKCIRRLLWVSSWYIPRHMYYKRYIRYLRTLYLKRIVERRNEWIRNNRVLSRAQLSMMHSVRSHFYETIKFARLYDSFFVDTIKKLGGKRRTNRRGHSFHGLEEISVLKYYDGVINEHFSYLKFKKPNKNPRHKGHRRRQLKNLRAYRLLSSTEFIYLISRFRLRLTLSSVQFNSINFSFGREVMRSRSIVSLLPEITIPVGYRFTLDRPITLRVYTKIVHRLLDTAYRFNKYVLKYKKRQSRFNVLQGRFFYKRRNIIRKRLVVRDLAASKWNKHLGKFKVFNHETTKSLFGFGQRIHSYLDLALYFGCQLGSLRFVINLMIISRLFVWLSVRRLYCYYRMRKHHVETSFILNPYRKPTKVLQMHLYGAWEAFKCEFAASRKRKWFSHAGYRVRLVAKCRMIQKYRVIRSKKQAKYKWQ